MYFFIRTDLPLAQQSVQSIHACYKMVLNYRPDHECPNVVYIGVPDKRALEKVMRKLRDNQIPHVRFDEPDFDYGLTAVATIPISGEQREVLSNYRLWSVDNWSEVCMTTISANVATTTAESG